MQPLYIFLLAILFVNAAEPHANLSYSKPYIHVLPELELSLQNSVERIIFLHIPKTAGTNVDYMASALSRMTNAFHYQRLTVPRIPGKCPVQISEGWIGGWEQLEIHPHLFNALPESYFLTGHFPYGLHDHLTLPAKYVTLVRNPIERELSVANFAYQRGLVQAKDFRSYLLDHMIDNPQVRLIAGKAAMTGSCTEATFNTAIKNIERDFLLVAPSEEVDTFLQILAGFRKWGPLAYAPMQITHKKVIETPDPALQDILKQKHRWDLCLYEWVKERWDRCKKDLILNQQESLSGQSILTFMPDHLSTQQPRWLTIDEIHAHNHIHSSETLLELTQ